MSYFQKLYENGELPHRAKLVYLYLHDRMDKERKAWPGNQNDRCGSVAVPQHRKASYSGSGKSSLIRMEPHYRENGSATSNRYYIL